MVIFCFSLSLPKKNSEDNYEEITSLKAVLDEAFSNKSYNLLTLGFFVCGFHVSFVATHLPAYLEDLTLPIWIGSWSLANDHEPIQIGKVRSSRYAGK